LQDNMVTIRERDTMTQERVEISALRGIIEKKVSFTNLLRSALN
jgi:glycyl-tRNA synthetase